MRLLALADCFKYRNKIGMDVCVEALNLYPTQRHRPSRVDLRGPRGKNKDFEGLFPLVCARKYSAKLSKVRCEVVS